MFVITMRIENPAETQEDKQYAVMAAEDNKSFHRQVRDLI